MALKFQVLNVLEVEIYDFSAIYNIGNLLGIEIVNTDGEVIARIHAKAPLNDEEVANAIVSSKLHVEDLTHLVRRT